MITSFIKNLQHHFIEHSLIKNLDDVDPGGECWYDQQSTIDCHTKE